MFKKDNSIIFSHQNSPLPTKPTKEYFASLDGLRGISILLVFVSHYGFPLLPGAFGVTIFFFVSGFLISRLLQNELLSTGSISLKNFYIRRVLRLAPALVFFVAFFGVLWWQLFTLFSFEALFAAIFYYFNYFKLFVGDVFPPYNVLWSLAVEEHYYIIFPGLFLFIGGMTKNTVKIFIFFAGFILLWRFMLLHLISEQSIALDYQYLKKSTDTRFDSILYGALLATMAFTSGANVFLEKLRTFSIAIVGGLIVIIGLSFKLPAFNQYEVISELQYTLRYTLTGIGLLLVLNYILFAKTATVFRTILSTPILVYIGKLSYSIYLWHLATLVTAKKLYPQDIGISMYLICTVITLIAALISYHFVELKFIKLRHKFGSNIMK